MDYIFCFNDSYDTANAHVERKKIDRGIQVICKWGDGERTGDGSPPTITYEARLDFGGEVNYRVKFNATVWASFSDRDRALVDEFRQALHELAEARDDRERDDRLNADVGNRKDAPDFFRGDIAVHSFNAPPSEPQTRLELSLKGGKKT